MMTKQPHDPHDDHFSPKSSVYPPKTDALNAERSLTGVYEDTEESVQNHSGARPQEVEPLAALMRRYHR